MSASNFLKDCVSNRTRASRTLGVWFRLLYGRVFWAAFPTVPIRWRLANGALFQFWPGHSFTRCIWPSIHHYEPDVAAALTRILKPACTFIDCGANTGYFSAIAGRAVGSNGTVVSIEPNPKTFSLLKANLELNHFGIALNCAVTEHPGTCTLFIPDDRGDSFGSLRKGGLVGETNTKSLIIDSRTLDEIAETLSLSRIDAIKIDVEGGEMQVLKSGVNALLRRRPVVIFEYGARTTWPAFGSTADDIIRFARDLKYDICVFDVDNDAFQKVKPEIWGLDYVNLALIPMS